LNIETMLAELTHRTGNDLIEIASHTLGVELKLPPPQAQ
jgi:hypothetical protein